MLPWAADSVPVRMRVLVLRVWRRTLNSGQIGGMAMTFRKTLLAACLLLVSGSAQAEQVLKLGHVLAANSQFSAAVKVMNEEVQKRTNGRYRIEEFPASSLGSGPAMLEATKLGTQDMIISSTGGALSKFNPDVGLLDLVGLIKNNAHADAVADGLIGKQLLDSFAKQNIKGLAWGEQGFRQLTNNVRPISSPKDMVGLTFRLAESEIYTKAFQTLGSKTVTIPFAQVYQTLQSGKADGEENPIPTILSAKLQEVQKFATISNHTWAGALIGINQDVFNDMTPEDQKIFVEAAHKGALASRQFVRQQEAKGIEALKAAGVKVNMEFDHAALTTALEPFYAEYAKIFGADKIAAIKAAAPK